ncbi:hamartin [Octopus bimaculoides]|uniref:Hamartin n=1 Tax=Octopus bimaculoides TaxID=37653 RepID=A0A0L8GIN7_OCTBM|nr:hamartin [Octopus bimaculoides]XP_014780651.1 hamartin [Octopus bimaculoides]XP_014780652.1 hamartin [Octopus bimaculoides]|eukprot:XP_014780650.1 PREDICTED: hamartin-like [Octopus bimaculoides]
MPDRMATECHSNIACSSSTVHEVNVKQLFNLLDNNDLAVVSQTRQLIQENLHTTKESWMVSGLLDYYLSTHSDEALKMLSAINKQHEKVLLDKLHESMKFPDHRLPILRIVLYAVGEEPQWLYQIGNANLFYDIIKCVKTDTDVPVLMTGLTILSALMPVLPKHTMPYLTDFFEIFGRVAEFTCEKPGSVPKIFVIHLKAALYAFFYRLYGMYPCNFLIFLRNFARREENRNIYKAIVKPMLERVRFNPLLVTESKEMETVSSRWHSKETHDILASCTSLILDPIEGTVYKDEEIPALFFCQKQGQRPSLDLATQPDNNIVTGNCSYRDSFLSSGSLDLNLSALCQPLKGDVLTPDAMLWWSPSLDAHLSTPPMSQGNSAAPSKGNTPILNSCEVDTQNTNHHSCSKMASCDMERPSQNTKVTPVSCCSSPIEERKAPEISMQSLHSFVDTFVSQDPSDVCDVEVAELTKRYSYEHSHKLMSLSNEEGQSSKAEACEKLSSDSVKQFMEKMNRIRFTSITTESDIDSFVIQDRFQNRVRSRSCPNIPGAERSMETSMDSKSISSTCSKIDGKIVQVETTGTQTEDIDLIASFSDDQNNANLVDVVPSAELINLYHFLLSPSPFSLCIRCKKSLDSTKETEDCSLELLGDCPNDQWINLSPVEILDKLLSRGAAQHDKELSQVPSTTQSNITRTCFGGSPPADDISILQNQIILMQNQLIYERLQREGFAKLAATKQINASHVTALKEQNSAILDQLRLQEKEIRDLQETIKKLQEVNCQLKQTEDKNQYSSIEKLKVCQAFCEKLKAENELLKNDLSEREKMAKEDRNNFQEANQKLFQAEKRLELMKKQVSDKEKLKEQMFLLQKELLLMGELQQRYQEKLDGVYYQCNEKEKRQHYVNTLEEETQELKKCLQQREVVAENWKSRWQELDENNKSKDITVEELKKCLDNVRNKFGEQIRVSEAKFDSVMKVNQNLQSHILKLRGEIVVLKKEALQKNEYLPESMIKETALSSEIVGVNSLTNNLPPLDTAEMQLDSSMLRNPTTPGISIV